MTTACSRGQANGPRCQLSRHDMGGPNCGENGPEERKKSDVQALSRSTHQPYMSKRLNKTDFTYI